MCRYLVKAVYALPLHMPGSILPIPWHGIIEYLRSMLSIIRAGLKAQVSTYTAGCVSMWRTAR